MRPELITLPSNKQWLTHLKSMWKLHSGTSKDETEHLIGTSNRRFHETFEGFPKKLIIWGYCDLHTIAMLPVSSFLLPWQESWVLSHHAWIHTPHILKFSHFLPANKFRINLDDVKRIFNTKGESIKLNNNLMNMCMPGSIKERTIPTPFGTFSACGCRKQCITLNTL